MSIQKLFRHLAKVFHRWPENWRFRKPSRLQNIVPARRNERAAHKYRVRQRINSAELSNGIEHQHVRVLVERPVEILLAASRNLPPARSDNLRCSAKPIGLPRRQHEQRPSPHALDVVVSRQHRLLFLRRHTAGYQNWPPLLPPNLRIEPRSK